MPSQNLIFTRNGRLEAESEATFEGMFDRLAAAEQPRLLLFMHGGLVNEEVGIDTARKLMVEFAPLVQEGWETVFPVWRSGLGETIRNNQDELATEPGFVRSILRLAEWIDSQLGGGAIDKAFIAFESIDTARLELEKWDDIDPATVEERLARKAGELGRTRNVEGLTDLHLGETELASALLADPAFVAQFTGDLPMVDPEMRERVLAARAVPLNDAATMLQSAEPGALVVALGIVRAGYRVLNRLLARRGHGVWPTVVEEVISAIYLDQVGAAAWDQMKRDARQHFDGGGAGARLLDGLARIAGTGKQVRVITIGHSAGSVFTARLAREAVDAPHSLVIDQILLAPAVRIDEAVGPLLSGRVDGLRIFTMSDAYEQANHLDDSPFGQLYHRSLLCLISGVLERDESARYPDAPLLGMARHLDPAYRPTRKERASLDKLAAVFASHPHPVVFSPTPQSSPPGSQTASRRHGCYWGDSQTLDSVRWIARNGMTRTHNRSTT